MKKLLSVFFVVSVLFTFTACGEFTCDFCEQESSGKKYELKEDGLTLTMCESCHELFGDEMDFDD